MHSKRVKNQEELGWWIRHISGDPGGWRESLLSEFADLPGYPALLHLGDRPCGRVLDVGCGPKSPARQLNHTEMWGVDPLIPWYAAIGFPVYDLGVVLLDCVAEDMWPIPRDWFDTIVSCNALDHCDDFAAVASEIERVAKPDAMIRLWIAYHAPTPTEPLDLDDETIRQSFCRFEMKMVHSCTHNSIVTEKLWTNKPDE